MNRKRLRKFYGEGLGLKVAAAYFEGQTISCSPFATDTHSVLDRSRDALTVAMSRSRKLFPL